MQVLDGDDAASNSDDSDFGDKVSKDVGCQDISASCLLLVVKQMLLLYAEMHARQLS